MIPAGLAPGQSAPDETVQRGLPAQRGVTPGNDAAGRARSSRAGLVEWWLGLSYLSVLFRKQMSRSCLEFLFLLQAVFLQKGEMRRRSLFSVRAMPPSPGWDSSPAQREACCFLLFCPAPFPSHSPFPTRLRVSISATLLGPFATDDVGMGEWVATVPGGHKYTYRMICMFHKLTAVDRSGSVVGAPGGLCVQQVSVLRPGAEAYLPARGEDVQACCCVERRKGCRVCFGRS